MAVLSPPVHQGVVVSPGQILFIDAGSTNDQPF